MWWLYLIFVLILALFGVIFVVAYGIKLSVRLDTNNMSVCMRLYILDYIELFCVKAFVCEGKFYYQINKRQIEEAIRQNAENTKKGAKKLNFAAYISKVIKSMPKINLSRLQIRYSSPTDDMKNAAVIDGTVDVATNSLLALSSQKLAVKEFNLKNSTDSNLVGAEIECVISFSLVKIALYFLYAAAIKNRYATA